MPKAARGDAIAVGIWLASGFTLSLAAMPQPPDGKAVPTPQPDVAPPLNGAPLPSEADLPAVGDPAAQVPANPLPSEQALPLAAPQTPPIEADADESVVPQMDQAAIAANVDNFGASEDSRPRLRLNFDGHTGPIRATTIASDGQWMASAGEDKDVHIWSPLATTPTGWFHRRTIRWQVKRSQRGRIYSVASRGSEVAFAGYGAMGGLGEIWIVDAISGNFIRELVDNTDGHRQVVVSLAWAPDGSRRLLSADVDGKVILWQADQDTGLWSHRTIVNDDRATYGDAWAEALKPFRDFVPIAWSGPNAVIVPRLVGVLKSRPTHSIGNWHALI